MATKNAPRINRKRRPATYSADDIESVDYANSKARANPVRSFRETVPRLSAEELEQTYRSCGIIFKGINKKARDAIRKGFIVIPDAEDREDRAALNAAAREWLRDTAYYPKAIKALREMFVFGDGFLELGYAEKGASSAAEPARGAKIAAVYNVDPFAILPVKDPETGDILAYLTPAGAPEPSAGTGQVSPLRRHAIDVRALDRRAVQKWAAGKGPLPKGVRAIHPKRIQHFQANSLRDHPDGLGISVIEAGYINAVAKLAGDHAAGDVLEWYAKGFFTLSIDFATQEELKKASAALEAAKRARKNHFVGSERSHFDIKSPSIPNIKQFYDVFYIEIAAALELPSMVLLGNQKGTVTGSSVDLLEYYDDVLSFQTLILDAPVLGMMRSVLRRQDIRLEWTPLFVDKQTQANIDLKRAQASAQLYGSRVLSRRQTIRFLRDGELPDPEGVPDDYSTGPEPDLPASEDEPAPPAEPDEEE